jgi:iron complex outermembrane receptor protein
MVDIWNNTPNTTNPTRQQVALFGDNFLMTSTPIVTPGSPSNVLGLAVGQPDPLCYCYETYHVQTDFENVNFNSDLGDGWRFDNKLFTYRYWNKQYYQNVGAGAIAPIILSTAKPSGVDKLNGYRQAGDIATMTKEMKWGILRFGAWYNWAYTDRYQIPDNPITQLDTPLGNFHEHFISQSFQPFVEYEWKVTPKFVIIAGVKAANYSRCGQGSRHRRADLRWRRAVHVPQHRLEQLAAQHRGALPRATQLVRVRPVRRRQHHSSDRRFRCAGWECHDSAPAANREDLPNRFGD